MRRQVFECGKMAEELTAFTDSDRAGGKEAFERHQVQAVLMLGRHTMKAYTRIQKVIAKSSCRSRTGYAAALGASECLKGVPNHDA